MARLLRFALLVILGLVIIAIAIPVLIPAETYRDRIRDEASRALNREVILAGDLSFQIFPAVQFTAREVSLANADGFGEAAMAEMAEMRVGVKLIPLFSRNVEISEFVLIDPVIRLEQNSRGNNWTFRAPDAPAPAPTSGEGFVRRPGALPFEASFGDVRVENATVIYSDASGRREITGLNLSVALPSLDGEAAIRGALTSEGERISFDGTLGSVRGLFEGAETPVAFNLGGNLVTATIQGVLPASEAFAFNGDVDINVPSVRNLAAFAGTELPPGDNMQAFQARGAVTATASLITLNAQALRFDDITGSGNLVADLTRTKPTLTGRLDLPALDISPYLPEQSTGDSAGSGGMPPWSEEEIDLSALGLVNADIDLAVGLFEYGELDIENVELAINLQNRRLDANLSNFQLYEGAGNIRVIANNRTATPSYRVTANLDSLNALPFLEAAAGFDRLMGTGGITLDLRASGASQAAIMNALSGNGEFGFSDGAIVGINIAETIRNVSQFFGTTEPAQADTEQSDTEAAETGEDARTDFSSLTGSFSITNGRVDNQDLAMLSPLLRMAGLGQVNLAGQSIDYRLRPRLVASIEGQGGSRDLRGVEVPVRIRGGFNDISVGVDTEAVGQALLRGALSNAIGGNSNARPEDVVRDSLLNAIGLGNSGEDDAEDGEDSESESRQQDPAEQLLRGLFGNRNRSSSDNSDEDDDNNR